MPTDVNQTIKDVTAVDHSQGGDAAFKKLMQEYNDYKQSGATDDQLKQFSKQVDQGLLADKVLPDLSISWAMSDTAKQLTMNGSEFTKYDLRTISTTTNFQGDTQIDQDMAGSLLKNYDQVKNSTLEPDWLGRDSGNITETDLKHEQQVSDSRALLGPLVQGNPPLWQAIDGAKDGSPDGTITKDDLQKYMYDYNNVTENGAYPGADGSPYSKANYDYVKNLWYNYDSPTAQFLRGPRGGTSFVNADGSYSLGCNANFDIKEVARTAGFGGDVNSIFELKKRYDDATPSAPAGDEPVTQPKPGDGTEPADPVTEPKPCDKTALINQIEKVMQLWSPSELRAAWQKLQNIADQHQGQGPDLPDGSNCQPDVTSIFKMSDDSNQNPSE